MTQMGSSCDEVFKKWQTIDADRLQCSVSVVP